MAPSRFLFAALAAALLAVACDTPPIAPCVGFGGAAAAADCRAGIGGAAGHAAGDAGHEAGDAGQEAGDAGEEAGDAGEEGG